MASFEIIFVVVVLSISAFLCYKLFKMVVCIIKAIRTLLKGIWNVVYALFSVPWVILPFGCAAAYGVYLQQYMVVVCCGIAYLIVFPFAFRYSVKREVKACVRQILAEDGMIQLPTDVVQWYVDTYESPGLSFYKNERISAAKSYVREWRTEDLQHLFPNTMFIHVVATQDTNVYIMKEAYDVLTVKIRQEATKERRLRKYIDSHGIITEETIQRCFIDLQYDLINAKPIADLYSDKHCKIVLQIMEKIIHQEVPLCLKRLMECFGFQKECYGTREWYISRSAVKALSHSMKFQEMVTCDAVLKELGCPEAGAFLAAEHAWPQILDTFKAMEPSFSFSLVQEGNSNRYLLVSTEKSDWIIRKHTCNACQNVFQTLTKYGNQQYCEVCLDAVKAAEKQGVPVKKRLSQEEFDSLPAAIREKLQKHSRM